MLTLSIFLVFKTGKRIVEEEVTELTEVVKYKGLIERLQHKIFY